MLGYCCLFSGFSESGTLPKMPCNKEDTSVLQALKPELLPTM